MAVAEDTGCGITALVAQLSAVVLVACADWYSLQ